MNAHAPATTDPDQIRRRVAHDLYQKFAFASFLIWTLGTLILFIMFAAGRPQPIPATGFAMSVPLIPALLIWVLYRPLVRLGVARRLRSASPAGSCADE